MAEIPNHFRVSHRDIHTNTNTHMNKPTLVKGNDTCCISPINLCVHLVRATRTTNWSYIANQPVNCCWQPMQLKMLWVTKIAIGKRDKLTPRRFLAVAPKVWNELPTMVSTARWTFKGKLKTHLYCLNFNWLWAISRASALHRVLACK